MEVQMDTMWDTVKKGLRDGAAVSVEKIEEYTKIGKLKIEELSAKRKIERTFMDLGERTFDLIDNGKDGTAIVADLTIQKAIENVKKLREELIDVEKKMKEITEAHKKNNKYDYSESDQDDEINSI
ncbi:MAG: hypothetical protein ACM31E_04805 [Fibrobacterota bacterium]